jgi:hypothetical protein
MQCCKENFVAKGNILDLWLWPFEAMRTATDITHTLMNAQAVINTRTPMIKAAIANPTTANTGELNRMVTEKVETFGRSQRKLAAGQSVIQNAVSANVRDLGRIAGGDLLNPADWFRIGQRNLQLWSTMATLPGDVLKPVSRRVAGNASRLRGAANKA